MSEKSLYTEHAPAERASPEEIERQYNKLTSQVFVNEILDSVPSMTAILNVERQIVYTNKKFDDLCGYGPIGKRPGEAINCMNADKCTGGCGTSIFCRTCGLAASILNSHKADEATGYECRLSHYANGETDALDLRVWSRPIDIDGETFTIFSMLDISDEKRRRVLERFFFHDIMNTVGGIQGISSMLMETGLSKAEVHELADLINVSAEELVEEIESQKALSSAEAGELIPILKTGGTRELLEISQKQYQKHPVADKKKIVIDPSSEDFALTADIALIHRVVGNLIKNGLEASCAGNSVVLHCHQKGAMAVFTVQNKGVIPMVVQRQIFNRSFSTKATDRGLGSYSVKLLVERYLKGSVSFVSSEKDDTIFRVEIPMDAKAIKKNSL